MEHYDTRGNRGAWCLYRTEAEVTHFEMLTFWDDTDAIKRFAVDDYSLAKYYNFDSDYLIEMEPHVRHYDVSSDSSPDLSQPTDGRKVRGGSTVARIWRGDVPTEKADAYLLSLVPFCFRDYQKHAGVCGIHLPHRMEEVRMQVLLLTFWESRQAIAAYAGVDFAKAHYYAYDLECLIDHRLTSKTMRS